MRQSRTIRSALISKPGFFPGTEGPKMSHRSDASIMDRLAPRTNGSQDRFAVRAVFCVPGGLSSGHGSPCRMAAPNRRSAHSFPNGGKRLPPRTPLPSPGTKHAAGSVSSRYRKTTLLKNHGADITMGPVWPVRGIFPIHTTLSCLPGGSVTAPCCQGTMPPNRSGCLPRGPARDVCFPVRAGPCNLKPCALRPIQARAMPTLRD